MSNRNLWEPIFAVTPKADGIRVKFSPPFPGADHYSICITEPHSVVCLGDTHWGNKSQETAFIRGLQRKMQYHIMIRPYDKDDNYLDSWVYRAYYFPAVSLHSSSSPHQISTTTKRYKTKLATTTLQPASARAQPTSTTLQPANVISIPTSKTLQPAVKTQPSSNTSQPAVRTQPSSTTLQLASARTKSTSSQTTSSTLHPTPRSSFGRSHVLHGKTTQWDPQPYFIAFSVIGVLLIIAILIFIFVNKRRIFGVQKRLSQRSSRNEEGGRSPDTPISIPDGTPYGDPMRMDALAELEFKYSDEDITECSELHEHRAIDTSCTMLIPPT